MTTYNLGDLFVGKDGNISKIVDIERKNKVVTLEHWDGVTSRIQYSTLRKHYTPYVAEKVDTVEEIKQEVTPEEPALVQEVIPEEPKKKEKKEKKAKRTFEELVADIPSPGNIRFIRAANGDVLVKRGNKRVFRYNGHTMIATSEKMFAGCEYEKQNWNGYVIHNVTADIMRKVFKNA